MVGKGRNRFNATLTKLDPATLRPKPQAVSQHSAESGRRVTATVKPVRDPLGTPEVPAIFNADPSSFRDEYREDDASEDEIVKEYYISRVRSFSLSA
jgi:hypothetical protein